MRILDLIDLNRGETLKQGDSTLLRFQIADRDHILPDRAGEQARVVFMYNNSIIHEEITNVLIGNIVEFSISEVLPPNVYSLEIHVGGQIFPSDEFVFKITRSALNAEHNIIKLYGVDNIVDRAVDLVSAKFINLTKEKLGLGNVINVKQASEMEVSQARGNYPNLNSRLDDVDNKQRQTTARLAQKAEQADLIVQRERISQLVANAGDTDGNAELLDIRLKGDGSTAISAGDAVRSQYMELKNAITSGEITESKDVVALKYPTYKDDTLIYANSTQIGKTLDEVLTSGSGGVKNYLIDVSNVTRITFPVFKTSDYWGCLLLDENNVVMQTLPNRTLETGTQRTLEIPTRATKFLLSISNSLSNFNWGIGFPTHLNLKIDDLVKDKVILSKAGVLEQYGKFDEGQYYNATISLGKKIDEAYGLRSSGCYTIKIDVTDKQYLSYPVFKTSEENGSLFLDVNDIVIWQHTETQSETGTLKTVAVPNGAKTFILSISASLSTMDWTVEFFKHTPKEVIAQIIDEIDNIKNIDVPIYNEETSKNLTLCALDTAIVDGRIPFHRGFLFHKMIDDRSLWYGKNFDNVKKIGTVDFYPKNCMLAISPKDGRVIATTRGINGSLYVWDKNTTTELFKSGSEVRPKGWLYNSGVDFINDDNGTEYCIFAEYSPGHSTSQGGFRVWRGKYPYTSESDWQVVMRKNYIYDEVDRTDGITHFHQVSRDPFTNVLYLTSGDTDEASHVWYSEDYGLNWTLLISQSNSGFPAQTLRFINFVFTKEYIYWAVDNGTNHALHRVERSASTGIIDFGTRVKLTDLPAGRATNSICYVEYPRGIFMYDRVDIGFDDYYDKGVDVQFWDLTTNKLETIMHLDLITPSWGGHRGKCYVNYTSGSEHRPAMGFSDDSKNQFDLSSENPANIGTVFYEIKNSVVKYMD